MRSRGAMMAISESGDHAGYLSGGCIDADVINQALEAINANQTLRLRYGAGSPFLDIALPCGGTIDLVIIPEPEIDVLMQFSNDLKARRKVEFYISQNNIALAKPTSDIASAYCIRPKLKIRIAGKGHEPIALAKLAKASGFDVELWTPDKDCAYFANEIAECRVEILDVPSALPEAYDDVHSAFVLMFHDHDWDVTFLKQALLGPAFFVGAVGSRRTHEKRVITLEKEGISRDLIDKIQAPVGLVPSMRDASSLAVSTLAHIVGSFNSVSNQQ